MPKKITYQQFFIPDKSLYFMNLQENKFFYKKN